jgi:tyrosyl-tRNA synthetase
MGGSDQWGNITAGVDLIRRVHGETAHALVYPLLTTSTGSKMGKSVGGAIWLDPQKTSPYQFYQYLFNSDDSDIINYLKVLTLLSKERIDELAVSVKEHPERREAQRELAREVTGRVHGQDAVFRAEEASRVLFGEEIKNQKLQDVMDIFAEAPSIEINKNEFSGDGLSLADLVARTGLAKSKGEARRLIEGGGIYLQNVRSNDARKMVSLQDSIEGQVYVLRKGQKDYCLVKLI